MNVKHNIKKSNKAPNKKVQRKPGVKYFVNSQV